MVVSCLLYISCCIAVLTAVLIAKASNGVLPKRRMVPAGSYDRFLNLQIALIIGMQLLMCLFCSLASYIWREHSGKQRYYLGMTEYVQVILHIWHTLALNCPITT